MKKAFTLVELMIVVAILGIMAAIALPQFQNNTLEAKESVSKDALRTMRGQIELYKMHHNGLAPGYIATMQAPLATLTNQFQGTSAINGAAVSSKTPASPYLYGPYVHAVPTNPFNNRATFKYVPNATEFSAAADDTTGWLYKKETGDLRLNTTGTDSAGDKYTDY